VKGTQLKLAREWLVGDRIGSGGFGQVFTASSGTDEAVVKFVPKARGADRELLFVDLKGVRNVVPVIDSGEHDDYWVLVMPRAEMSLRDYLDGVGAPLSLEEALDVITDICDALVDLDGKIIHRDLKPANVLRLDGRWCLADFGISRYVEATTAPDTQKFALSPPYAAPERWRSERATSAADIYAVGVMTFEMLSGVVPFVGPSFEDFRHQHLHADPPHLANVPPPVAALVDECLYKAPEARPGAANVRARLDRAAATVASPGLARLQEANREEVHRRGDASRQQSEARTEAERREALATASKRSLERISTEVRAAIVEAAPAVAQSDSDHGGWTLGLHRAELRLSSLRRHAFGAWGGRAGPAFDVVCFASLSLIIPADAYGYEGRSHSLWYGDVQQAGQFDWFETAFMISPLIPRQSRQAPFSLEPGPESATAVGPGMGEFQLAWPFTRLVVGELDDIIDRWAAWFAEAAEGRLRHPSTMPEIQPDGSWRRS